MKHTMKCVLAVVGVQMIDFSVEREARISDSVCYSSHKRSEVTGTILVAKSKAER